RPPAPRSDNAQRYRARARPRPRQSAARMFETRSQAWREAGLVRQISPRVVRRARLEALLLAPIFIGIALLYEYRNSLLKGAGAFRTPVQIVSVLVLMALGWVIARAFGRAFGPALFRRLDPPTAGTVGFLVRLATLIACFVVALKVANVKAQTLEIGGAVTAVVIGLAAQQTLGNVIAGIVLLSASPFRVGDRIHLQGGSLGGPVEGVVGSLGLFYTTLHRDGGSTMLPNSVMLNALLIREDDTEHPL
ncbi:MAG: mechanosensitive ion channel domain-containing protein, partial [Solirubrobacteraceae bacterium]